MADSAIPDQTSDKSAGRLSLSEHVVRNVQAITELHLQAERTLSAHQRAIETVTARLGRPASLYAILAVVALWTIGNGLAPVVGLRPLDPPPFFWLQGLICLAGLLTATMVLITQNRQAKLHERRMHLDLQVNLLTEQKTAKLIDLVEELRRDLPNVRDRCDPEAEILMRSAEPLKVIAALDRQVMEAAALVLEAEQEARGAGEQAPSAPVLHGIEGSE